LNKPVGEEEKKTPLLLSRKRMTRKEKEKKILFELNIDLIFEKIN
jgi:hypothetical protein